MADLDTDTSDTEYLVEEIRDHTEKDNEIYYLIKWKDYDSDYNSWEPLRNLKCPGLLKKYIEKLKPKRGRRPKPKTPEQKAKTPDKKLTTSNKRALTPDNNPTTSGKKTKTPEPKPSTSGFKPSTPEPKPSTSGFKPSTPGKKTKTLDQKPSTSGLKPSTPEPKPSTSGLKPSSSGLKTSTSSLKQPTSSLKPSTSGLKPSTSGLKPSTTSQKTKTPSKKAKTSGESLLTSGQRPTSSGQRPTSSGQRPTSSGQRPTSSGQKPTSSGQKLTSSKSSEMVCFSDISSLATSSATNKMVSQLDRINKRKHISSSDSTIDSSTNKRDFEYDADIDQPSSSFAGKRKTEEFIHDNLGDELGNVVKEEVFDLESDIDVEGYESGEEIDLDCSTSFVVPDHNYKPVRIIDLCLINNQKYFIVLFDDNKCYYITPEVANDRFRELVLRYYLNKGIKYNTQFRNF